MPHKQHSWPEQITAKLKQLPSSPGVYEMINKDHETLYVGKAKNLRKRVQTYFRNSANHSPRIAKMLEKTQDLSWTEVSSEVEALILESNLIKEKRPKFNILLRDDKNFAYFCISMKEDFPRIFLTRRIVKDGSIYIGPKTSAGSVRKTIDLLQDIFQFRSTNLLITEHTPGNVHVQNPGNIKFPCLNFHINKCHAPCIGNITKTEYRAKIDAAVKFLRGHTAPVLKDLEHQMRTAASDQQFEKAARIRDLFLTVKTISEKQVVSALDEFSADVIGTVEKFDRAFFHVFQVREGKVINSETFSLSLQNAENLTESLFAFLREHADRIADTPRHILLSDQVFPPSESESWSQFFTQKWEHSVQISLPQKGKRKKLLQLAEHNANSYAQRNAASFLKKTQDHEHTLSILQQKLHIPNLPTRIECYDISHLGGTETVASMVVATDGIPQSSQYRRFQLKTLAHGEIDDFKSMREVLTRRLRHIPRLKPTDWTIKKPSSKKLLQQIQNIFDQQISPLPVEIQKEGILALFQEKSLRGFLRHTQTADDQQTITHIWTDPEIGQHDAQFFLIQKLTQTTDLITITDPNLLHTITPQILSELHFQHKKNEWKWKKPQKNKPRDSLQKVPDLIVIDGGKGQLSAANTILQQFPCSEHITLCSLAKKQEEVYIPSSKTPIAITKSSPEGLLLQRIRDEAHRFAVSYYKKLHQKSQQKSALDSIPGVGTKIKKKLLTTFGSVAGIRSATDNELIACVGKKISQSLRRNL